MIIVRIILAVLGMIILMAFGLAWFPTLAEVSRDAATDSRTATGLSCATGAGTSCSVTLPSEHYHPDTSGMTVTETSPGSGSRTATSSLNASNRVTLTVSSLSAGTTYIFTVAYLETPSDVSSPLSDALRLLPIGVVLAVFVIGVMLTAGVLIRRRYA